MSIAFYIHIPFCEQKCGYCDFLSMPSTNDVIDRYFQSLYLQLQSKADEITDGVGSIYIGGGTPSFVNFRYIDRIMETIRSNYKIENNAEITIEANPASAMKNKLSAYKSFGINRLSFGLQSTNDELLKILGRIHNVSDFYNCFDTARNLGFDNINVDLMYALPKQKVVDYLDSIKILCNLGPEHISAYSLIIEEGTAFYNKYANDENERISGGNPESLCSEDDEIKMLHLGCQILDSYGYQRYEISNYAKIGYESKHNTVYWNRGDYFGFGLGASSLIKNKRFNVTNDMDKFLNYVHNKENDIYQDYIDLSSKDALNEAVMLGLRLTKGISIDKINNRYNTNIEKVFEKEIDRHIQNGLLIRNNGNLFLSDRGLELANIVMRDFV